MLFWEGNMTILQNAVKSRETLEIVTDAIGYPG